MPTDAREFIAVGKSVLPMRARLSLNLRFGGGSVLVWGRIMVGNKIRLIVINGNINAQTYINDVLAVEALLSIQFHGPNVTFMHDNTRPHLAAITRQFLATMSSTGLRIVWTLTPKNRFGTSYGAAFEEIMQYTL